MSNQKVQITPKKILITATSLVLALTIIVTTLGITAPTRGLTAYAASSVLTSVSEKNSIPEQYEALNVPAGTYTMPLDENGKMPSAPVKSENGVAAFDFHIFAENFASKAHTCGNIAVENLGAAVLGVTGAPEFGSRSNHDTNSIKLSYVGNTTGWSSSATADVFVFGEENSIVTGSGQVKLQSNGKEFLMGNDNNGSLTNKIYLDNQDEDSTPFINIQAELDEAEDYQRYLVWLMQQAEDNPGTNDRGTTTDPNGQKVIRLDYLNDLQKCAGWGPGGTTIDFNKPEYKNYDTIIIDFDTYYNAGGWFSWPGWQSNANSIINGKVTIRGTAGKRIIFNVDTTNLPDDSINFSGINMSADGIHNSEDAVTKDNNILWNFYKTNANGVPVSTTGTVSLSGTWVGTVLAPDATVKCDAGLNGSIIAKNVTTSAETHKSDYTGEQAAKGDKTDITVTKKWEDNPLFRPDFISIQLLRDGKAVESVQLSASNAVADDKKTDGYDESKYVWTYTFENLPVSDPRGNIYRYEVKETVPDGYSGTVFNYTIVNTAEGGRQEVEEPVVVYGRLTVSKVDAQSTGTLLAGAQFKLTSNNGANLSAVNADSDTVTNFIASDNQVTWTSVSGKAAALSNLPLGTYTLTEVSAPAGYVLSSNNTVTFDITEDHEENAYSQTITNEKNQVKFAKLAADTNQLLAGAELELRSNYGADLGGITVNGTAIANGTSTYKWTSTGNEVIFAGMPDGSYTITETKAPKVGEVQYDIAAPITFVVNGSNVTVDGNNVNRVEMVDAVKPEIVVERFYAVTFNKVDNNNTALSGAEFTLTSIGKSDLSNVKLNGNNVTVSGDNNSVITFTGSSAAFTNLPAGTYTITETQAPAGYKKAAPISFTVNETTVTFDEENGNQTTQLIYTMVNAPITMEIGKKDSLTGEFLSGAELTLTGPNGTQTWTTDGTLKVLSKLPVGSYTLTESKTPAGYVTASPINFTVDEYGNISGDGFNGNVCIMYDAPSVINIAKQYSIDAVDEDGKTTTVTGKLAGAVLQLTSEDGSIDLSNVTGSLELTHVDDYTIQWVSGAAANQLRYVPDGVYILREIEAPSGYDLSEDMRITVTNGAISKVEQKATAVSGAVSWTPDNDVSDNTATMTDQKTQFHSLVLSKIDADAYIKDNTATLVAGATLAVFKADTTSFASEYAERVFKTEVDENDTPVPTKLMLPDGDYVLIELEAPEGYEKTPAKTYFTVKNGTLEVTALDTEELAVATSGNPIDIGLGADVKNAYYTLETSGIFEQYGEYPTFIRFSLGDADTQYVCSNFTLYKEGSDGVPQVVISDSTQTDPANDWSFSLGNSVENKYEPGYTYYAVVQMKDTSGNYLTGDEVGSIQLKMDYPLITTSGQQSITTSNGTAFSGQSIALTPGKYPEKFILEFTDKETGLPLECNSKVSFSIYRSDRSETRFEHDSQNKTAVSRAEIIPEFTEDWLTADPNFSAFTYVLETKDLQPTNLLDTVDIKLIIDYGIGGSTGGTQSGDATIDVEDSFSENLGSLGGAPSNTETADPISKKIYESVGGETAYVVLPNYKTPDEYDHAFSFMLTKEDESGSAIKNNSASFLLYDANNNLVTNLVQETSGVDGVYKYDATAASSTINTEASPLKTSADGTLVVNGLDQGAYNIYEIEAPANYEITQEATTFVLNLNHIASNPKQVTVKNALQTGNFIIDKTDDAGNPIKGAGFNLYKVDSKGTATLVTYNQTSSKPEDNIYYTGNDGRVTATELPFGYLYYAVEVATPDGYTNDNTDVKLPQLRQEDGTASRYTINHIENGNTTVTNTYTYGVYLGTIDGTNVKYETGTYANASDTTGTWTAATETLLFKDGSTAVTNTASKTVFLKTDEAGKPLAGATFKLTVNNPTAEAQLAFVTANVITERDVRFTDQNGNTEDANGNPITNAKGETYYTETVYTPVALTHYHDTVKDAEGKDVIVNGSKVYEEYIMWTSTEDTAGVTLFGLPANTEVAEDNSVTKLDLYTLTEVSAPAGYTPITGSIAFTVGASEPIEIENAKITNGINLSATKELTSKELTAEAFQFQLLDDKNNVLQTKYNDANGNITFDAITYTFDDIGTKTYTVKEVLPEGVDENNKKLNGITYDTNGYTVTVTIAASEDGTGLDVTAAYDSGSAIVFNNIYDADDTSLTIGGTKTLTGRDMAANEFTFELYAADENFTVTGTEALSTAKNAAAADGVSSAFSFDSIAYDTAGDYYYVVKEVKGGTTANGVTYDSANHQIKVTVEDVNGQLTVTSATVDDIAVIDPANGISVAFTNNYNADDTSLTISGTKTLTGRDMAANEFTFELYAADENFTVTGTEALRTAKNTAAADGVSSAFSFNSISYDAAGDYYYVVKEANGGTTANGVTYDSTSHKIKVTVTDVNGQLTVASVTVNGTAVENPANGVSVSFANRYDAEDTSLAIGGTKTYDKAIPENTFEVVLYGEDGTAEIAKTYVGTNGTFVFPGQSYSSTGTFKYVVKETIPATAANNKLNGIIYDDTVYNIEVTVIDNNGQLTVSSVTVNGTAVEDLTNGVSVSFANTYDADDTSLAIGGTKTLTGRDMAANEFTFQLWAANEQFAPVGTEALRTAKNTAAADGVSSAFSFNSISYDTAGDYYYVVKEANGGTTANGITYDSTSHQIKVTVTDVNGQLTVTSVTVNGTSVENPSNGITVAFSNSYSADAAALTFNGTKTLTGRDMAANEFTFQLWTATEQFAPVGTEALRTAKNTAAASGVSNSFILGTINYTEAGTYYYVAKEASGSLGGITYDTTVYNIVVTVDDNNSGKLEVTSVVVNGTEVIDGTEADDLANSISVSFSNSYAPTVGVSESITAKKTLSGKALTAEMFAFTLTGHGQNQEKKNDVNGNIVFDSITWNAAGTYTYTIAEANAGQTVNGTTYSSDSYQWIVVVGDNGNGGFEIVSQSFTKNGTAHTGDIEFANTYTAAPAPFTLSGTKQLVGGTLAAEAYNFALYASNENGETATNMPAISSAKNNADGSFSFREMTLDTTGYFIIREVIPADLNGITYDTREYLVTVPVTDNGAGQYEVDEDAITIQARNGSDGTFEAATEVKFVNTVDGYNLTLSKIDLNANTSAELPGAMLSLTPVLSTPDDKCDLSKVVLPTDVKIENGSIVWRSTSTPTTIGMVPNGIYKFTETTAPEGYECAESIYVKVDNGSIYSVNESVYAGADTNWGTTPAEGNKVIMRDDYNKLVISKQDAVNCEELPGATLTIKPVVSSTDITGIELPQGVKRENGAITWKSTGEPVVLEHLLNGVYTLTETTSPSGYEVDETAYILVSGSDIYSVKASDYDEEDTEWGTTPADGDKVIMEDAYNNLFLSKVEFGGGDELPGATLILEPYGRNGGDLSNVIVSGSDVISDSDVSSDSDAESDSISWISTDKPTHLINIPNGTYKFTEITAPYGYAVAESIYIKIDGGDVYYTLDDDLDDLTLVGDDTVAMADKPTELVLSKMAVGGGKELPGAVLTFQPVDNSIDLSKFTPPAGVERTDNVLSWTSGDKAVELNMLPTGIYKFTELTAPDGYLVAETIYVNISKSGEIFSVKESAYKSDGTTNWGTAVDKNTVIMLDAPVPEPKTANISFVKYSNLSKILPGATFSLTDASGVSKTATSGVDGTVLFSSISEGVYTLTETKAPDNYIKSSAVITVTVDSQGVVSYKNANGTELDLTGVENLVRNTVVPVKEDHDVNVGDSVNLRDELLKENDDLKNENITWVSKDESIATVDQNGNVTIKKPGTVTIEAYKGNTIVGSFVLGATDQNAPSNSTNNTNTVPNTGLVADESEANARRTNAIIFNVTIVGLGIALAVGKIISNRRNKRKNADV